MNASLETAAAATSAADGARGSYQFGPGLAIALLSAAAFGLSGSLAHAMLSLGWSPVATVMVRVGGAFVVLAVPCSLLLRRTGRPTLRQSGRMAAYGVVAIAGAQLCYFSAVQYLSVGVALLLEYLAPVLLIGWFWLREHRRPGLPVIAGALLAMTGLVLVLDLNNGLTLSPLGVAWGLGAAVCLAVYFVLSQENGRGSSVPPLVLTTVGTGVGGAVLAVIGLTGALPLRFGVGDTTLGEQSVPWWLPLLLLIGVTAVLAYLTGIMAVRRLGSSVASFVGLAEVLFAVAFAALLLGQHPAGTQLVGGVLVVAGIAAVQTGPMLSRRRR